MADRPLGHRTLRRRADRAAAAARRAASDARTHLSRARGRAELWCGSWQGAITLFGAGLAGGLAAARRDAADTVPNGKGAAGECADDPGTVQAKRSLIRDLVALALARVATSVLLGARASLGGAAGTAPDSGG